MKRRYRKKRTKRNNLIKKEGGSKMNIKNIWKRILRTHLKCSHGKTIREIKADGISVLECAKCVLTPEEHNIPDESILALRNSD